MLGTRRAAALRLASPELAHLIDNIGVRVACDGVSSREVAPEAGDLDLREGLPLPGDAPRPEGEAARPR